MDLKRLTQIVALAEHKSFARAAEHLRISQPALSRSIQAAEEEFGLRLFDRGGVNVTPTPSGEFLIDRARRLVFEGRCLQRDMDLLREKKLGNVAFGVGPYPAATFLVKVLTELRQTCPGIQTEVVVGNAEGLLKHLKDERIEFFVGVTHELDPDPDLQIRFLGYARPKALVRAGHPLSQQPGITLKDAWNYGVASVRIPSYVSEVLADMMGLPAGSPLPVAIQCESIETLKKVTLNSDLVLVAPRESVTSELASGELQELTVMELPDRIADINIVSLRGRSFSPVGEWIVRRMPSLIASQ